MQLDKRRAESIFFIGDGPRISKHVIEEGDEATLYYKGNLGMATITSMKGNQMVGTITRSPYDPHLHSELTIGKEIRFLEENIFGISKMTNKA